MRHPVTILLLGVASLGLVLSAQQQQAAVPEPAATDPVHTVVIDAILIDARGRLVDDLKPSEFDLHEDAEQRMIDNVQLVRVDPTRPGSGSGSSRLFAIYIDEYHISAGTSATRAREALTRFITQEVGPNDLIVVMRPLESLFDIHMTHDRDTAGHIAAGLEGRRGDYTARNDYEKNYMAGDPDRIEGARDQVALSAINALAVNLAPLGTSRKNLIVVTEALTRPPRQRGQEYLTTLDQAVRSANRSNTSVYVVDPRDGQVDANDPGRVAMQLLANQTDGALIADTDLGTALQRVARESSVYYLVTYHSAHKEDGRFHPVRLRIARPGVKVRARSGYWAPSVDDALRASLLARSRESRPPPAPEPARHVSTLISPWFGVSLGEKGLTRVTFVWEPVARVPGDRNQQSASRIDLTALGPDDRVLFDGPVLPTGRAAAATQEAARSRAVFDVVPGRLRVRMKIQNNATQQIDTDVRDVAVRDFRAPIALGTPQIFRARNARELRLLGEDPKAAPVASRDFSRTEELLIRFPLYGAPSTQLTASAKLLNRAGQMMRDLPVQPVPALDEWHQLGLSLAGLAPGEYMVELSATSQAGEAKDRLTFKVTY